jgi:hypothetical protein
MRVMRKLPVVPICRRSAGLLKTRIIAMIRIVPCRREGRYAIVTSVGYGMRWTQRRVRRARLRRTAKACGPGTPGLVLSVRAMTARDGDYEVTDTGESTRISVNTIAQGKPDCSVYL